MARASHLKLVQPSDAGARAAAWVETLGAAYTEDDLALLKAAAERAIPALEKRRLAGDEPALDHAFAVTTILRELGLDPPMIAASLLSYVADSHDHIVSIRDHFGAHIAELAEGIARMALIEQLGGRAALGDARASDKAAQLESLRKMLLAMVQDVRVVLVKLADHLQTMRYVVKCPDLQARHDAARLSFDIFAPLANRLGVWQLKWELEDLALRILEPDVYKDIAAKLDGKRGDREHYVEAVITKLRAELAHAGIEAEITGRAKHINSIYNKMKRKNVDFDALYDVRAVRVLVPDIKDCYTVLGIVHNLWTPLPKEFDDYIAKPKSNNYRSLHTAVIGPEGKAVEVQIRTFEMHRQAELGVASHWRYKEGGRESARDRRTNYDEKIAWLRHVLEWKDEVADAGDLAAQFRSELFADTIYVLTPQGRVVDLPKDATPIDFAYHIHSDLGHRCRGAKVDNVMVPLNTPLKNGQQVEILAAKQGGPSRDWLNPALGFIKSASARIKVRQWFNKQNLETSIAEGRAFVEKELQRQGKTAINLEQLAKQLDFERLDDFLAEAGRGQISARQIENALKGQTKNAGIRGELAGEPALLEDEAPKVHAPRAKPGGILVVGVDKLLTIPARCCKPAPPDAIIGFVTRGRGVTIHRAECPNVKRLAPERLIEAEWGKGVDASVNATFPVDIVIEATDRHGLTREVTELLAREHINVTTTRVTSRDASLHMVMTVEIANLEQLNRVLTHVRDIAGVAFAARR